MSEKEILIDRQAVIEWAQAELKSIKRIDRNGRIDMYAAGAAKVYEVIIELLKLGAFTKKETCP